MLVNAAGIGIAGSIGDLSTKRYDLQMDINVRGHAERAELVGRRAHPLRRARRERQRIAVLAEHARDCEADPGGAAGDECRLHMRCVSGRGGFVHVESSGGKVACLASSPLP